MLHNLTLALSHAATRYAISGQLIETQEQQCVTHNSAKILVKRGLSVKWQTQIKQIKKCKL